MDICIYIFLRDAHYIQHVYYSWFFEFIAVWDTLDRYLVFYFSNTIEMQTL